MRYGLARDMQMPFMRRVEGAAEQADSKTIPVAVSGYRKAQGRICPLPRTV
jgi:hypothetical protein